MEQLLREAVANEAVVSQHERRENRYVWAAARFFGSKAGVEIPSLDFFKEWLKSFCIKTEWVDQYVETFVVKNKDKPTVSHLVGLLLHSLRRWDIRPSQKTLDRIKVLRQIKWAPAKQRRLLSMQKKKAEQHDTLSPQVGGLLDWLSTATVQELRARFAHAAAKKEMAQYTKKECMTMVNKTDKQLKAWQLEAHAYFLLLGSTGRRGVTA